jgi:hypothetical protein
MSLLALATTALTLSIATLAADNPCYTLVNATNHEVVLNYVPVAPGEPADVHKFSPGAKMMFCFPRPSGTLTANIATTEAKWEGGQPMVMGRARPALPPGTYRIVSR